MSATVAATRDSLARSRFAWLNVVVAAWIVVGVMLVVRALNLELATDVAISPYHLVGYTGLAALALLSAALVARAVRRGNRPLRAFPAGFGTLGLGLVAAIAYVVLDPVWRDAIGIRFGIENGFAPTRLLLTTALVLIAVGPLRAALLDLGGPRIGWPATVSAALLLTVLASTGGFHPVVGQWVDKPAPSRADDSEIWSMQPDGSGQTRLIDAEDHVDVNTPAVSPDGSQIAFTRWRQVGDDWHADVWVANVDGSEARAVAEGPGRDWIPHWSADGAWIGYTVDPTPAGSGAAVAGAQPRPAPGPGDAGFGPLRPPAAVDAVNAELWRVAAAGGQPEQVTSARGHDRAGDWSPDGTSVVFDADRDGNTEIYVQADGGDDVRVTDDPGEDWAPDWAPDGSQIAFTSDRTGNEEIWVVEPDGTGLRQLTDDPAADRGPSWTPDGSRIVFASWRTGEPEIWSMAADGSDPRNLSNSAGTVDGDWDAGDVAPDGRIYFARNAHADAGDHPVAREDLALGGLLLNAALAAFGALLLARIGPPFGAITVLFGAWTALLAVQWDAWRFVPAAVVAGLVVDVLMRRERRQRRAIVVAVASATAFAAAILVTVVLTTGTAWTPTLILGALLASAAVGYGLAVLAAPSRSLGGPTPDRSTARR